jgi:hypothetical protein
MVNETGGDSFGVEEGCCAVRIEDGSKVEVAVAMGEVAEESNTVVEAKRGLCDVFVLAKNFGVNSNIVDNLELGEEV